jgi:hypothetical protein
LSADITPAPRFESGERIMLCSSKKRGIVVRHHSAASVVVRLDTEPEDRDVWCEALCREGVLVPGARVRVAGRESGTLISPVGDLLLRVRLDRDGRVHTFNRSVLLRPLDAASA